jgi:hypothetical protein
LSPLRSHQQNRKCHAKLLGLEKQKENQDYQTTKKVNSFIRCFFSYICMSRRTAIAAKRGGGLTPNKSERFQNKLKAAKDALTLKEQSTKKEKNFLLFSLA